MVHVQQVRKKRGKGGSRVQSTTGVKIVREIDMGGGALYNRVSLLGVARSTSPRVVVQGEHKIGVNEGTYSLIKYMTGPQYLLLYRIGREPFYPSRFQPSHYPRVVKPTREGREGEKGIWFGGGRQRR
jgi:hypothetical protein